jgi:hypothetical protein
MDPGTQLQLRRLKWAGSQTAPQTIPPCGLGRSYAPQGPLVKVGREGPAAHLQPPVRKSVSTSQAATARLWCRNRGATKLMACAHPQGIASAPRRVLPAIPKGDVSAPPAPMHLGSIPVRRVQEAHQEHSGVTRQPARHTKPAMFWRSAGRRPARAPTLRAPMVSRSTRLRAVGPDAAPNSPDNSTLQARSIQQATSGSQITPGRGRPLGVLASCRMPNGSSTASQAR